MPNAVNSTPSLNGTGKFHKNRLSGRIKPANLVRDMKKPGASVFRKDLQGRPEIFEVNKQTLHLESSSDDDGNFKNQLFRLEKWNR